MKNIMLILLIATFFSCKKESLPDVPTNQCVMEFMAKNNLKEVPVDKGICIFYTIWQYENELYLEYNCCVCDLIPRILKCNGDVYIDDFDKIAEFKTKAKASSNILVEK
jgi:hypothetical protein